MEVLSKLNLKYEPTENENAVNKKYVDNLVSTTSPENCLYGKELDPYDHELDTTGNAETLHGLTWEEFALSNHSHTSEDIGLGDVTNDRQMKAVQDTEAQYNHVVVFKLTGDGSQVKDSGMTIGKSVPRDAVFTDTTYEPTTDTKDGLFTVENKQKLDSIDAKNKIYQFNTVEEMKSYDMSEYPYEFAYGCVGETQYKWKKSNTELEDCGKWRIVNDTDDKLFNLKSFTIDENGILKAILQTTNGITTTETEEIIGRISMLYRGEYNISTTYNILDLIFCNDKMYMCLVNNTKGIAPTDTNNWLKLTEKAKSAYDIYTEYAEGDILDEEQWLKSLQGKDGVNVIACGISDDGNLLITTNNNGLTEEDLPENATLLDGNIIYNVGTVKAKSNYDIAVDNGFEGTEEEWLESITKSSAAKLSEKRNINGILFDGSSDGTTFCKCSTLKDQSIKDIGLSDYKPVFGCDLRVMFIDGNSQENVSFRFNKDAENETVYKVNGDISDIEPGDIVTFVFVVSTNPFLP